MIVRQISDAQINMFGNQLSRLHDLSYLAAQEKSYDVVASRIKEMLRDTIHQKQFLSYLKNLGLNA